MGSHADARLVGEFAAAFLKLGHAGGARKVGEMAWICICDDIMCLDDFAGLPSVAASRRLSDYLSQDDIDFLDRVALPAAELSHSKAQVEATPVAPVVCGIAKRRRTGFSIEKPIEAMRVAVVAEAESKASRTRPWSGPRAEIDLLCNKSFSEAARIRWLEDARVRAILGSCPKSHASVMSGLRCWFAFASKVLHRSGSELPPTVDGLVQWSLMFRCSRTFQNYLNYVNLGCEIMRVPTESTKSSAVKRALAAVDKRGVFVSRERQFIGRDLVVKLMSLAKNANCKNEGMLYLAAYVFLLRVPSEALPMSSTCIGSAATSKSSSSVIALIGDEVVLTLACRKNKQQGSRLLRKCWCSKWPETCPVHVLWEYFAKLREGTQPFRGLRIGAVLANLRGRLKTLEVVGAASFRTHDFRRGHARDLQRQGADLFEILAAGEWRSPAFLKYLSTAELERDVVLQAHLDESSDDEA